jgi:heme A synthase
MPQSACGFQTWPVCDIEKAISFRNILARTPFFVEMSHRVAAQSNKSIS